MSGVGDNSIAVDTLRNFVERVERLTDERNGITSDIRYVLAEANSQGYDPKIIRTIVKYRQAADLAGIRETRRLEEVYAHALGMDLA